jgi:hypothetical protein
MKEAATLDPDFVYAFAIDWLFSASREKQSSRPFGWPSSFGAAASQFST